MNDKMPQFLSTATAARLLGLSTTLIQTLVDKNELQGWKTRGGHRRISLQSIEEYRTHARMVTNTPQRRKAIPKIMVAIEAADVRETLQDHARLWNFPIEVQFVDSLMEALLTLGSERPDLLLVELAMPKAQQEKTMLALENFNARGRPIPMVLVTNEIGPNAGPSTSKHIQLAPGPLSNVWLHAYMTGVVATCRP